MHDLAPKPTAPAAWSSREAQRCPACGGTKAAGRCASCERTGTERVAAVQAKLHVSQPGDEHEREADRVADAVVAGGRGTPRLEAPTRMVHRQEAGLEDPDLEDEEEEELELDEALEEEGDEALSSELRVPDTPVQRKGKGPPRTTASIPRGGGEPLAADTSRFMERGLGHNFADVRVHADAAAGESAERINAKAYTHGSHIYFGPGAYQPSSTEGRHLIAHELTHVLQQRAGAQGVFRDKKRKDPPKRQKKGPKRIKVFLDQQKAVAMEGDKVVKSLSISSGKPGHPTDTGTGFKISERDADHRSNKYGKCGNRDVSNGASSCKKGESYVGAPMTNFLRFNGAEGFHKGVLPGHPASHGCVRLSGSDSQWLFKWAEIGTPVDVLATSPKKPGRKKGTSKKKSAPKRKGR